MISSLHKIVSNAAIKWPRNIALIEDGRSITYKRLNDLVRSFAGELIRNGLRRGQRVGILSTNSINSCAMLFAISRAGGVAVPLNYTQDAADISAAAIDASMSSLYVGKAFEDKAGLANSAIRKMKAKKGQDAKPKDLALIVYTSGTTTAGALGVMLSNKNLISNAASVMKYAGLKGKDRIVCVLPLYYIYGLSLLLSHFLAGGTVILENRFMYPNVVLDVIEKYRATGFAGVSSHYAILLRGSNLKDRKLPYLKYFMQAGDAMPPSLTRELLETFPGKRLFLMYGQTEAGPRLTFLDPPLAKIKPGSVGRPVPGVEIKIVDETDRVCGVGEEGEIAARGDNIMLGYWNNKRQTEKVLKKGWLYTGDIGYRDEDGDISVVGRRRDFLKIGGHRVSPLEIERLVMGLDGIMEAAVVGVQDPIMGNRVKLVVSLMPHKKLDKEDIIKFCKRRLAPYKAPVEIAILKSMPKNDEGKIDKEALRVLC